MSVLKKPKLNSLWCIKRCLLIEIISFVRKSVNSGELLKAKNNRKLGYIHSFFKRRPCLLKFENSKTIDTGSEDFLGLTISEKPSISHNPSFFSYFLLNASFFQEIETLDLKSFGLGFIDTISFNVITFLKQCNYKKLKELTLPMFKFHKDFYVCKFSGYGEVIKHGMKSELNNHTTGFTCLHNLQKLSIAYDEMKVTNCFQVKMNNLKELILYYDDSNTDEYYSNFMLRAILIKELMPNLKSIKGLRSFDLDKNFRIENLEEVELKVSKLNNLNCMSKSLFEKPLIKLIKLSINGEITFTNRRGTECSDVFYANLLKCQNLEEIHLKDLIFEDSFVMQIRKNFSFPQLKKLSMINCDLVPKTVITLIMKYFKHRDDLVILDFSRNSNLRTESFSRQVER